MGYLISSISLSYKLKTYKETAELNIGKVTVRGIIENYNSHTCYIKTDTIFHKQDTLTSEINLLFSMPNMTIKKEIGDTIIINGKVSMHPLNLVWDIPFLNSGKIYKCHIDTLIKNHGQQLFLKKFHKKIQNIYLNNLSFKSANFLIAIVLGKKDFLESETKIKFIKSGYAHLLVLSGLHAGFLVALLVFILNFTSLTHKYYWLVITPILFTYLTLVSFPPSLLRASLMIIIFYVSYPLRRYYSLFQIIFQGGTLALLLYPLQILSWSFYLSYGAVIIIALAIQNIHETQNIFKKLIRLPISISFFITMILLPITQLFNTIPNILGIITSFIAIPLVGIIYGIAIVLLLVYKIGILSNFCCCLLEVLIEFLYNIRDFCLTFTCGYFQFHYNYLLIIVTILLALSIILFLRKCYTLSRITITIGFILIVYSIYQIQDPDLNHKFEGNNQLIHIKGQTFLLIDKINYKFYHKILKPFLIKNNYHKVNIISIRDNSLNHFVITDLSREFHIQTIFVSKKKHLFFKHLIPHTNLIDIDAYQAIFYQDTLLLQNKKTN